MIDYSFVDCNLNNAMDNSYFLATINDAMDDLHNPCDKLNTAVINNNILLDLEDNSINILPDFNDDKNTPYLIHKDRIRNITVW